MCGIAGIFGYHYASLEIDRSELRRIRDHMRSRGPDGVGEWFSQDGHVGLGHRRLAIIDLNERANQPMASANGDIVVTFNGEIYNYAALRKDLEARGHVFRTESDTEVLLHLYVEKGQAMVHDLRGMFAFALWDSRKRALMLARDPYGIKPLYYADDGWTVRFASQVKALLAGASISRDSEPAGIVGFYLFGSVPEPFTVWQDIRAVPAGSTVWVDDRGASAPTHYYSIAHACVAGQREPLHLPTAELMEYARDAFLDSVKHHLVSDVPVGAFLSGGIDSGSLVALMRMAGQSEIQTITLAFSEFSGTNDDEAPLAEHVARQLGTRHVTRTITQAEFHEDLPLILECMDQPSIDGINSWFVSKAARELGLKVAISGLGGDELLGGYPSFARIPCMVNGLAVPARIPAMGRLVRVIASKLLGAHISMNPKGAGLLEYGGTYPGAYLLTRGVFMPWELDTVLDREIVDEGLRRLRPLEYIGRFLQPMPKAPASRVAILESVLYMRNQLLRDADWSSMAHSLEVRVPLVDCWLFKRLAKVIGRKSFSLRKTLLSQGLPALQEVSSRRKTGFSIPVATWLLREPRVERWRTIPSLSGRHCHWARRWAHALASIQR